MPSLSFRIKFGTNTRVVSKYPLTDCSLDSDYCSSFSIWYINKLTHLFKGEFIPFFFFKLKTDKPCEPRLIVWFQRF